MVVFVNKVEMFEEVRVLLIEVIDLGVVLEKFKIFIKN